MWKQDKGGKMSIVPLCIYIFFVVVVIEPTRCSLNEKNLNNNPEEKKKSYGKIVETS